MTDYPNDRSEESPPGSGKLQRKPFGGRIQQIWSVGGNFWIWPLLAGVVWTATLLGLLLWWIVVDNRVKYRGSEADIVFISDVGAVHKALFVSGTALTFIFYSITLLTERYLRHLRRIPGSLTRNNRETKLSIASVVFGVLGGFFLLMLSIFDTFTYSMAHWILTALFIVCIVISAILQTSEIRVLENGHPDRAHLRRTAIFKLVIVIAALASAIAFAITLGFCRSTGNSTSETPLTPRCNVIGSVAGGLEWAIAFLFGFYLFTFILDLWPARKTTGHMFDEKLIEGDRLNQLHSHTDDRPGHRGGLDQEKNENTNGRTEGLNTETSNSVYSGDNAV